MSRLITEINNFCMFLTNMKIFGMGISPDPKTTELVKTIFCLSRLTLINCILSKLK